MGILNVTPDSFADGGAALRCRRGRRRRPADGRGGRRHPRRRRRVDAARARSRSPADEELRRVLPVIERLAATRGVPSRSTPTRRSSRARRSRAARRSSTTSAGCSTIRSWRRSSRRRGAALVLMHNRGRSRDDVPRGGLRRRGRPRSPRSCEAAIDARGRRRRQPRGHHRRSRASASRSAPSTPTRRWRGSTRLARARPADPVRAVAQVVPDAALGDAPPAERDWGTAAAVTASVLLGAHIVRVHGVARDGRRRPGRAGSGCRRSAARACRADGTRHGVSERRTSPPLATDKLAFSMPDTSPACSAPAAARLVGSARHRHRLDPDL